MFGHHVHDILLDMKPYTIQQSVVGKQTKLQHSYVSALPWQQPPDVMKPLETILITSTVFNIYIT